MRQLAGGVSVVTAASGHVRTGMTVTSVVSVTADPPELLVSVNKLASSWPFIEATRRFGVNVLASHQGEVARRFSGQGGLKGEQRYEGARWQCTPEGVWLLDSALAAMACELVQVHHHGSHALLIGRVDGLRASPPEAGPLLYWQGDYGSLTTSGAGYDPIPA
jgi:flavin reductase (DIM6/NTAB) family NADH-FMN oxidoreductase RutF